MYVTSRLEACMLTYRLDLSLRSCRTECVRLKDFVVNAEITDNDIENCGVHDYMFDSGDKNGEGVYIGTSSTQVKRGPHRPHAMRCTETAVG